MYRKHPKGTEIELYGGIKANIPPVGIVWDFFSGEWKETGVYSRSSRKSEQYWERQDLPSWYAKKRREEEAIILETGDRDFVFEECEQVRKEHWMRRMNGMWFMNNGVPTYITGLHWFYLNWWPIDIGYPWYFDYDRKRFYHIDYCNQDPKCFGRVEVGPRRMGKTFVGGVFIFEPTSREKNSNAGIQSKTNPDAKKVFGKALVSQFRKLPHFFKPVYDTSAGTIPKSEIRFFNTSQKGTKVRIEDMEDELESIIDFRASGLYSYDGEKTIRMLHDEIFKTEEVDVYERYKVVKECLVDNITETIIGKYMGTSTVEEVEGQLATYQKMWDESNPSDERDGNGHTKSGLYHYFISAAETRGVDKFGNCDIAKNTKTILNTIEGMRGDQKAVSDFKRKYPLSIKDAFRPQAKDCHYDLQLLEDRYDLLSVLDAKYRRVDLRWNDISDRSKGVKVVEKTNGNFLLHKDISLDEDWFNNVGYMGSTPYPKNKSKFSFGCDPFDHRTTVDGRKSDGSGAVFRKYDSMLPVAKSDKFVLIYRHRPKKPTMFYDDMLKICWLFGCEMLFEDNKPGIREYFEEVAKCKKFLMHLPDRKEPGVPASPKTHEELVDKTAEYIEDCHNLIDYPELITDWIKFDIMNTTKFDLGMSSGYALIAANRVMNKKQETKKETFIEITDIFRIYN